MKRNSINELDVMVDPAHTVLNNLRTALEYGELSEKEIRKLFDLRRGELLEALTKDLLDQSWSYQTSSNGKLMRAAGIPVQMSGRSVTLMNSAVLEAWVKGGSYGVTRKHDK